jgi:hypothetical protein
MKRLPELILPGIPTIVPVFLTCFVSFSSALAGSSVGKPCFMFYLMPFGIGFSQGGQGFAI